MRKTVGKLHAMLIEYEKSLPKKAETPQVMMIKDGKIQKSNKKSLKAKDNCHYAPSITRGVVSVHHLVENGFVQRFTDYGISVSKNDVLYFNAIARNGIYEIDMHNLVPNVNSIYNVSTKRAKRNRSYIVPKKVTDLLGIIHTDVCGLLRHVSRQGASYFIIFTDDYSRYGYVYLLKHKHELTPPYTPQHNGVSERRNRTLLDMVRSMMNLTTLPLSFWDYALESATRILNMVPTKKVDKTPYELWYGKVPNLYYLKVWGCEALVKQDSPEKLQQRSVKCIFIGYPKETMGFYFYFPPKNKIVVARYAEFFEKNLITQEVSERAIDLEEIQDEDTSPSEITSKISMEVEGFEPPQEEVISIRRSERTHQAPDRLCLNVEVEEHSLGDLNEPASYKAAIAIRILISIAAFYDYEIWQMDVKTAFLNGYLDEDIYMVQPEGFVNPNHPRKASGSNVTFLILYVDDIIIMGNHIPSLQSVKDYLGKCFAIKDLGEAEFILGIKIYRDRTQVASTPKEVTRMQNVPYASAVGSIINTKDMFLVYGGNPEAELRVDCYCDAGFETDRDDTKSQTGYVFILNGGAVD
nr:retrotransposon protein, putative, Ty1-copia subclass [Tanacetum cinerariifolium]